MVYTVDWEACRRKERERCAKIADDIAKRLHEDVARYAAENGLPPPSNHDHSKALGAQAVADAIRKLSD